MTKVSRSSGVSVEVFGYLEAVDHGLRTRRASRRPFTSMEFSSAPGVPK